MKIQSRLAVGPLSEEIIEGTVRYSHNHGVELMLISSMNQIDWNGGYVNNWTTSQYSKFFNSLKNKYPKSTVYLCRDHCGPNFKDHNQEIDVIKTITEDIRNGFRLIHLDLCRSADKTNEIKELMRYALSLNNDILFEVGTDENDGNVIANNLESVERDLEDILQICKPEFYVLQTGSLVKEAKQVGCFEVKIVTQFCELLKKYDIKLKEHNADYLTSGQIKERVGLVGAMNIAPQLGVVQTSVVLNQCLIHGISTDSFMRTVYEGNRWRKWSLGHLNNYYASTLVAGHYHFTCEEYLNIIFKLNKHLNIKELIISSIEKVINHYVQGLSYDQ